MWSFASNAIASIGLRKNSTEPSQACSESSDDEVFSNVSREEGLECPICLESFNIVENVPYVLWCGHTLCKNCVLGLQCAVLKFSIQQIKVPYFISCPWCHLLSFRMVYKGNLMFPRKNFFLLWMVESMNGDRTMIGPSSCDDNQPIWSPKCKLVLRNQVGSDVIRRASYSHYSRQLSSLRNDSSNGEERHNFSFHKSLDFFINFTSKFPLVILFLVIAFFAIPSSVLILTLYLLITVILAIPSFLVLYFAYPVLDRLVREITS